MHAWELDEIYPDSERAARAFHMARAGVGARESLRASNEPFMPFRETDRRGGHAKGEAVVLCVTHEAVITRTVHGHTGSHVTSHTRGAARDDRRCGHCHRGGRVLAAAKELA